MANADCTIARQKDLSVAIRADRQVRKSAGVAMKSGTKSAARRVMIILIWRAKFQRVTSRAIAVILVTE